MMNLYESISIFAFFVIVFYPLFFTFDFFVDKDNQVVIFGGSKRKITGKCQIKSQHTQYTTLACQGNKFTLHGNKRFVIKVHKENIDAFLTLFGQ